MQGKSCLQQLASIIPGYSGYLDKDRRRDIDKLHREHLAQELEKLKTPITNLIRDLSETGRITEIKPIERLNGKLDKIANRIRYASYGYGGFFDVVKVQELELDKLYQFDLSLAEDTEAIKTQVLAISESSDVSSLKTAASSLEKALDSLDAHFSQRHKAIETIVF